jgi:hypothetical protein
MSFYFLCIQIDPPGATTEGLGPPQIDAAVVQSLSTAADRCGAEANVPQRGLVGGAFSGAWVGWDEPLVLGTCSELGRLPRETGKRIGCSGACGCGGLITAFGGVAQAPSLGA